MSEHLRTTGLLALALGLGLAGPGEAAADPPNVIIVLIDDVGYGDFSCHGNPVAKTPGIDRLHSHCIRLTDFHVCPMCTPTRGQLLTGRDALANGAMNVSSGRTPLRRDLPTAADLFAAAGYRTGHFGKWHLGDNYPYRPTDRGFQESVSCRSWGISSAADHWNNDCQNDHYFHNNVLKQYPGYNTDVFFAEAIRWMKDCHQRKQPFFVYLPTTASHGPHFVAERYRQPYADQMPKLAGFFGMTANIDDNLEKLDAWLRAEGLYDNTILVFLTDNGGTAGVPIFNAGMRGGKTQYYEGGHRVPCFLRWPAGRLGKPRDIPELTQCQDLLPTLLDLCGLKKSAAFDGISLAPALRGEARVPDRVLVVQYSRIPAPRPQKGDACVLWQRWRLVHDRELYDLDKDPAQTNNVIERHPDVVQKLRAHYDQWWAKVEPNLDRFQPISVGGPEDPVRLAPGDWQDVHCDQSAQVRRGEKKNAPWNVKVEQAGNYQIALYRWPSESGLALTAAAAEHKGELGNLPAGAALPIARARLRIGDVDQTQPVQPGDQSAVFTVHLKAGETKLQTWFYDKDGNELCGAYYTEVRRQ